MAKRLIRVNCVKCKKPYKPSEAETRSAGIRPEQLGKATFMRGTGCSHCNQTGYRGRLGIFEMMKMTSQIREMTFTQAPTQHIRKVARQTGMRNLLEDGVLKILKGTTTVEEVLSICHTESADLLAGR